MNNNKYQMQYIERPSRSSLTALCFHFTCQLIYSSMTFKEQKQRQQEVHLNGYRKSGRFATWRTHFSRFLPFCLHFSSTPLMYSKRNKTFPTDDLTGFRRHEEKSGSREIGKALWQCHLQAAVASRHTIPNHASLSSTAQRLPLHVACKLCVVVVVVACGF